MIEAVSICHYDFQNAHRNKFPIWNVTARVQFLCACAIPLLSRCVTEQNDNDDSGAKSVLCTVICEACISCFCSAGIPATI